MNQSLIEELQTCGRCGAPLEGTNGPVGCACGAVHQMHVFPALLAPRPSGRGGDILLETDSSCFHHPTRRAETVCGCCGRFLCSVCDIPISDIHYCPSCLEQRLQDKESTEFAQSRTHYDSIALVLSIVPFLSFFFCLPLPLATAPAAVGLSLWHWKTPCSILPRSRWRFVLAILLGAVQLVLFLLVFGFFFSSIFLAM